MATYELLHLGRLITVDTFKFERGGWGWRYSIDNGEPRESEGLPMNDETFARKEAERIAMNEIGKRA
ncbi:hypothetical protein BH09PSE5_BH09PSE5_44170 [soil metagenome]